MEYRGESLIADFLMHHVISSNTQTDWAADEDHSSLIWKLLDSC